MIDIIASLLHIRIQGEPIAKARHRARRQGTGIKCYNPQAQQDNWVAYLLAHELAGRPPVEDQPLEVRLLFGVAKPKSHRKYPAVKPDLDNLIKSILDCANGILWSDDKLICRILAEKIYVDEPFTDIKIYKMSDN